MGELPGESCYRGVLWHKWVSPNKPCARLPVQTSQIEEELFRRCTSIQLGNEQKAKFGNENWLKSSTARKALAAGTLLHRMNTEEELHQIAELWTQLQTRRLEDLELRTTSLGVLRLPDCTRQSQHTNTLFIGSFADHDWARIWKLEVEPKCHLFTCLLLQWRLPTADRIIRQGGQ